MADWFAVWTRSRHERAVCTQLKALGIESFLPTTSRVSRWKDRATRIDWPLFPGYCFAKCEAAVVHAVARCHGVAAVLTEGGRHAVVPDDQISALMRLVQTTLAYDACTPVVPGEPVRVVRGPLAGVRGRLIRGSHDAQLLLSVELLNSAARVWVSDLDVEAVRMHGRQVAVPGPSRDAVA